MFLIKPALVAALIAAPALLAPVATQDHDRGSHAAPAPQTPPAPPQPITCPMMQGMTGHRGDGKAMPQREHGKPAPDALPITGGMEDMPCMHGKARAAAALAAPAPSHGNR